IDPDVSDLLIKNSLFFNNFNDFGGWAYAIPPGVKEIVTTNVNGDSCDTFFNLFMDPYFADTDSYFLSDSSPCIDAGDPTLPWDPDGTPPDIGAHYYDQRDWVNPVRRVPPRKPTLYPGYPNPFNTRVTFEYELNNPLQYVVLNVLDIRGKVVNTLVSAYKPKGWHRATWDGNAPNGEPLPSGVYLLRLREYNRKYLQKALLIR
ncbi:T9SS type A sorting domain-containing protein, partial [bacterium]|nr:T9SS type A sorting domain-containing protein [bacterium]